MSVNLTSGASAFLQDLTLPHPRRITGKRGRDLPASWPSPDPAPAPPQLTVALARSLKVAEEAGIGRKATRVPPRTRSRGRAGPAVCWDPAPPPTDILCWRLIPTVGLERVRGAPGQRSEMCWAAVNYLLQTGTAPWPGTLLPSAHSGTNPPGWWQELWHRPIFTQFI